MCERERVCASRTPPPPALRLRAPSAWSALRQLGNRGKPATDKPTRAEWPCTGAARSAVTNLPAISRWCPRSRRSKGASPSSENGCTNRLRAVGDSSRCKLARCARCHAWCRARRRARCAAHGQQFRPHTRQSIRLGRPHQSRSREMDLRQLLLGGAGVSQELSGDGLATVRVGRVGGGGGSVFWAVDGAAEL